VPAGTRVATDEDVSMPFSFTTVDVHTMMTSGGGVLVAAGTGSAGVDAGAATEGAGAAVVGGASVEGLWASVTSPPGAFVGGTAGTSPVEASALATSLGALERAPAATRTPPLASTTTSTAPTNAAVHRERENTDHVRTTGNPLVDPHARRPAT